jgi:hypothetical protein
MRKLCSFVIVVVMLSLPVVAQAQNASARVMDLSAYTLDRDKGVTPLELGRRFRTDLAKQDPVLADSVTEAVRFEIQIDETEKFIKHTTHVMWAYGIAWVLLVIFACVMYARHQRIAAELAGLEARLAKEKA